MITLAAQDSVRKGKCTNNDRKTVMKATHISCSVNVAVYRMLAVQLYHSCLVSSRSEDVRKVLIDSVQ